MCDGPSLYAAEVDGAVHAMTVGRGAIKDRLFDAFLEFHMLKPCDFPAGLQDDFARVKGELTKKDPKGRALLGGKVILGVEGQIGASLKGMRLNKAEAIAERIYGLESRVRHIVKTGV